MNSENLGWNKVFVVTRAELIQWGAAVLVGVILICWDTFSSDKNDEMQKRIDALERQLQQCRAHGENAAQLMRDPDAKRIMCAVK